MSLCLLRVSLSGSLTASGQGSPTTIGEFLNISVLDPLLPTFLIATLCLCALSVITYYSLALAWEVFWASRRSPSPLDPSAEVVLTVARLDLSGGHEVLEVLVVGDDDRRYATKVREVLLPFLQCFDNSE